MAQKIFHEHSRELNSFEENERLLGIMEPGVYRGFDTPSFVGVNLTLTHTATGIEKTLITGNTLSNKTGVVISKQGSIIHFDASVVLPVDYNTGNSAKRIDLVVVEHDYQNSPGGLDAVPQIIKGPLSSETEPALTDPYQQVIIGKIYLQIGATDHSLSTYKREEPKLLGNQIIELQSTNATISISKLESVTGKKYNLDSVPIKEIAITNYNDHKIAGQYFKTNLADAANSPVSTGGNAWMRIGILEVSGKVNPSNPDLTIVSQTWTTIFNDKYYRTYYEDDYVGGPSWSSWTQPATEGYADSAAAAAAEAAASSKAEKTQPSWITLTGAFTSATGRSPKYRKNEFGKVEIIGAIAVTVSGQDVFVLPAAYRPPVAISLYSYPITDLISPTIDGFKLIIDSNTGQATISGTTGVGYLFQMDIGFYTN